MLSETQKGLLQLLKEIDDICTRHDIDWYLAGGSMIGAVRHSGFLPWDDDADIHMTKEGAEKFISLADEFLPGRIVVSKNTHKDYSAVHWRYMDTNKTTMLRSSFITDVPQGQFVDIFILNPIPNDESLHPEILQKYYLYSEWVVNHFSALSVREDSLFDEYMKLRKREKTEDYEKIRKELEDEIFEYPGQECDYYLIRSPLAGKPIYHKSFWGKPRRIPFEDTMFPVPEKAEEVLLQAYGDRWVDIPGMTDQETHVFVSDQDLPYTVYDEEIKRFANKKEMLDFAYRKKDIWFSHAKDRNLANSKARASTQFMIIEEIKKKAKPHTVEKMIKGKYYARLRKMFSLYYRVQFSDFKYYGLYFDMPETLLYGALLPLVIHGQYNRARSVLEKRKANVGEPKQERLKVMYDFCVDMAQMTNDIFIHKDYEAAECLNDKWFKVFPESITLIRARYFFSLNRKAVDLETVRSQIMQDLKVYKEDGELLKYTGDTYRLQGDNKTAIKYYKRAKVTINNGLLLTEMNHFLESKEDA